MRFAICLLAVIICHSFAQQPPAEGARPARQPPPPPKNLKLLKPEGLIGVMQAYRTALGVQCSFCHVQGDFASDEKHHKEIARTMIVMTREINAKFGEEGKVTCYTCHHGAAHPQSAPVATSAGAQAAGSTITGCLAKADTEASYTLTDEKTGSKTRVSGSPDLEKHSANHRVTLTGNRSDDRFVVTAVQHLADTCQAAEVR